MKKSTLQGIKIRRSTIKGLPIENNIVTEVYFLSIDEKIMLFLYNGIIFSTNKPKNWIDSETLGSRNILISLYGENSATMIEVF